jgi:hypothetical protein
VLEPVHLFWVLIAVLSVAAACNHGWHHTRHEHHLAERLVRASHHGRGTDIRALDRPAGEPGNEPARTG